MFKDSEKKTLLIRIMVIMVLFVITCLTIMLHQNTPSKIVKVGIVDSRIEDKYLSKYDVISVRNTVTDPTIINHGTTILSIIKQMNEAQIFYASTLDSSLKANIDDVVKAIYWCVQNDVDIINMSFATTEDNPLLRKAIQSAIEKHIIIVASCINYYDGYSYPAMYNGVISVSDGDFNKSTILVKRQTYAVKLLNGNVIKSSGTSCAAAYVTNQISKELAGKTSEHIMKRLKS